MTTSINSSKQSKKFWNKFSNQCTISTMMLNANADLFDEDERAEILDSLPDFTGMIVADFGAGIGRFTSKFAEKAKRVISTDFVNSFILENKTRNMHFNNIEYHTTSALYVNIAPRSVDLIFTNWLLMYLSNREVIQFLSNAIKWLRPLGYLHLRESCTESSTRASSSSMHNSTNTNSTNYRYSSVYIKLLKHIRLTDENGDTFRFEVLWSNSVYAYILQEKNWRQVHWLVRKVPVVEHERFECSSLLKLFSTTWVREQNQWDAVFENQPFSWTNEIFETALGERDISARLVFVFNPRRSFFHAYINANRLSERFKCDVWSVEVDEYFYRTSLSLADKCNNPNVRVAWHSALNSATEYFSRSKVLFDGFFGCDMSFEDMMELRELTKILRRKYFIFILGSSCDAVNWLQKNSNFLEATDVSTQCSIEMNKSVKEMRKYNISMQGTVPKVDGWILLHNKCD